ncbi:D-glycero-beta-D-manno-heptose 1-phosphate adenylyltransferase [Sporomusa termitida]|uniref:D-glycero-beta-D-manno-heptose 1-phosphate adenylyltransferase n=1 Tax=Sporomusa termitida TaxID=2377 RepID=A0A517DXH2_9FIRM|nr:D-glycero-beta-D-manno-heptose 1-phosphate adenylyltransferase [Sporomusa termitida]QDR82047.1 D-beta-D-heptose 1-phosphate adenylyltransferase [Sporomusa termitida]
MNIIAYADIGTLAAQLKAAGKIIVFTNGCFDILHAGHVRYLNGARALGDCLIVGLNSDESVRRLKGPTRPVNDQQDRAEVLAALRAVDYVVVFPETTAENIVAAVQPAVYAKGGDYSVKDLPESHIVESYGGRVVLIPEVAGRSSSNIIRKISGRQA